MNAIATRDPDQGAVAPVQSESGRMLAMVLEAAKDPNIDAAKMEQMVNLTTNLRDREREEQFNRDLNAAIMEMPYITKAGEIIIPANPNKGTPERKQGKFARYEDIDRVCRPILAAHNLAIRFKTGTAGEGAITITPVISHSNGWTEIGDSMRVPSDTSGSKNAAQAVGSALQYGKRYAYCAALNIVTEGVDDDGNLGVGLVVNLTYEREQRVLADAQAAFDQGRYQEWFDSASPKDRGYLVTSGKHAEFGGRAMPQITHQPPPRKEAGPPAQATQQRTPDNTGPEPPQGAGAEKRQTPAQWVKAFKAKVDSLGTLDKLDEYWDGKNEQLAQLRAQDPALWQEAHDYISTKREALAEGRLV